MHWYAFPSHFHDFLTQNGISYQSDCVSMVSYMLFAFYGKSIRFASGSLGTYLHIYSINGTSHCYKSRPLGNH